MKDEITIKFKKNDLVKLIAGIGMYVKDLDEDKEYSLTIKEYKQKRSLNANNLCWCLIDKLAVKLNLPKEDIYREYVKNIGGNSNLLCMQEKAAQDFARIWSSNGIGWFTEFELSKLKGCINLRAYYGSSQFDTAQMSRMINLIVQDCAEQGIETPEEHELNRLCEEWNK